MWRRGEAHQERRPAGRAAVGLVCCFAACLLFVGLVRDTCFSQVRDSFADGFGGLRVGGLRFGGLRFGRIRPIATSANYDQTTTDRTRSDYDHDYDQWGGPSGETCGVWVEEECCVEHTWSRIVVVAPAPPVVSA